MTALGVAVILVAVILVAVILVALVVLARRVGDLEAVVDIMLDSDTLQVDWNAAQVSLGRHQIEINAHLATHIQTVAKEVVDMRAATSDVLATHEARLDDIQKEIE